MYSKLISISSDACLHFFGLVTEGDMRDWRGFASSRRWACDLLCTLL